MRPKKINKSYIYERDERKCYFCEKPLPFQQTSLDHYLPKSRGGPNDIYNIVLSCKRCNKYKKSAVPKDYEEVIIALFKQGVKDRKIIAVNIKLQKILEDIEAIHRIEEIGDYVVFQSNNKRVYVKHNKIVKLVVIGNYEGN
ncbi:HNH endonuclease [Natronincola peptidivorans]|uniref:HNH endonuclease n=1 Tax=Natronincola peptidivorans TaxID=426128 RepID=A0A1I0FMD5_9FIRM|nr:HNH endonuclease [Natronincola peptidivorans]SET59539.1 HNH endonuclease [Natronincola peptidivorans]